MWKQITNQNIYYRREYGKFKIYRHQIINQEIQKYQHTLNQKQQYQKWKKNTMWRNKSDYLVKIMQFSQIDENNGIQFCIQKRNLNIFVERIPLRLSDLTDIPYPQNLYFLLATLKGFKYLYSYPYTLKDFQLTENMICLTKQGLIKVWFHPNLSSNIPLAISNIKNDNYYYSPEDIIKTIINIIQQNTDQKDYVYTFRQYLHDKNLYITADFNIAIQYLYNYARDMKVTIPKCAYSVKDILNKDLLYSQREVQQDRQNSHQQTPHRRLQTKNDQHNHQNISSTIFYHERPKYETNNSFHNVQFSKIDNNFLHQRYVPLINKQQNIFHQRQSISHEKNGRISNQYESQRKTPTFYYTQKQKRNSSSLHNNIQKNQNQNVNRLLNFNQSPTKQQSYTPYNAASQNVQPINNIHANINSQPQRYFNPINTHTVQNRYPIINPQPILINKIGNNIIQYRSNSQQKSFNVNFNQFSPPKVNFQNRDKINNNFLNKPLHGTNYSTNQRRIIYPINNVSPNFSYNIHPNQNEKLINPPKPYKHSNNTFIPQDQTYNNFPIRTVNSEIRLIPQNRSNKIYIKKQQQNHLNPIQKISSMKKSFPTILQQSYEQNKLSPTINPQICNKNKNKYENRNNSEQKYQKIKYYTKRNQQQILDPQIAEDLMRYMN